MIRMPPLPSLFTPWLKSLFLLGFSWQLNAAAAQADELTTDNFTAFTAESMQAIKAERQGREFLLGLWSVDCPPCLVELELMGKLLRLNPDLPLVLISTDSIDQRQLAAEFLQDFSLDQIDSWMFADGFVERLRFSIDPDWYGELPRSYFFNTEHRIKSHSGIMTPELLAEWFSNTLIID